MTRKDNKARFLALLLAGIVSFTAVTQTVPPGVQQPAAVPTETQNRVLLAISSNKYPVIPGDTYRLTYRAGGAVVVTDFIVESNYALNLGIFGRIGTEGKTYTDVKAEAERLVTKAYPSSLPSLTLVSVGIFEVIVRGAIPQTVFMNAWGLTRLYDVVDGTIAAYSSIRNIRIISRNGRTARYDLLKALRSGDSDQNPFIKPGDIIEISRADRIIEIRGEVYRPGLYQLLPNETLEDLDFFAGGFTQNADVTRIKIERNRDAAGTVVYFNFNTASTEGLASGKVVFENGDILTIPSKSETMPVVFIEGAIETSQPSSGTLPEFITPAIPVGTTSVAQAVVTGIQGYNRIIYPFKQGQTVYDALNSIRSNIAPFANLSQAYIVRQGGEERVPVDLERLLYDYTVREQDIQLRPFDRIIIPSSSFDITITGELPAPGRYPFVPQKKADYYVSMAGGVSLLTGVVANQVSLFNSDGGRKEIGADVEPGDRIFVHPNSNVVTVNGAVSVPGTYTFVPQERPEYYVSRAGGVDFERAADGKVTVFAMNGKKRAPGEYVEPGDRVYVNTDSFAYNFNRYFPIITTGLTFITTMVTLINLFYNGGNPSD